MIAVYLYLLSLVCVINHAQIFEDEDYASDYPFYPQYVEQEAEQEYYHTPVVIRKQSGIDIILKCNTTSCQHNKNKIIWEFKACQPDFKYDPCSKFYKLNNDRYIKESSTWSIVNKNAITRKKCNYNLVLKNASENDSGLYRCIESNRIIQTYEVEVIDSVKYDSYLLPELLDIVPSNITVLQNSQIIIQCRVYSKQPPVILWFKESDMTQYDIHYYGKFYSRISTSVQVYPVPQTLNVYLSKLNIHNAQNIDSGVYVCVAMTENGKDYKDAMVNVLTAANYVESSTSLSLLFLIPIALALVPVSMWLWYYKRKRKSFPSNCQAELQQESVLIRSNANGILVVV